MENEKWFRDYTIDNEITQRREWYSYHKKTEFITRELIDKFFNGRSDRDGCISMLHLNINLDLIGRWGKYPSKNPNKDLTKFSNLI